jgi:DNA-directed RNA polymerase subunit RPC12/RpoP
MYLLIVAKKVWWQCNEGHKWQSTISHRAQGSGCPYCSVLYVIKGKTDLQTVNPRLAKEWDYEKNNELTPADVSPNSDKKVWWECIKGHKWQAKIGHRNHGSGCPYCSKRRKLTSKN